VTPQAEPPQTARSKRTVKPHISTAIILNRSPILTRTPSPFEKAYYSYQARIRRALYNPFPHDFYFKQGTLLETRFNLEERKREKLAFGPSILQDDYVSEEKRAADVAAVEQLAQQEGEGEELASRTHSTDESWDVKSLDRAGERNLYLLLQTVENGKEGWRFPQGDLEKGQFLHQVCQHLDISCSPSLKSSKAAQQDLYAECGDKMDTWVVGKAPVGVYKPPQPSVSQETPEVSISLHSYLRIAHGDCSVLCSFTKHISWLAKSNLRKRTLRTSPG